MNPLDACNDKINTLVSKHFFDESWVERHRNIDGMIPDYCNSVDDAWPVIVKNKISIYFDFDDCGSNAAISGDHHWMDANPLRAAMIVFLMMKDA